MLSLIITIISIALVSALAITAVYYGGQAYTRYGDAAVLTKYYNDQLQIQGAAALFAADNKVSPTSVAELVSGDYLKNPPAGDWAFSDGYTVSLAVIPDALCLAYNRQQGVDIIPSCSDPAYSTMSVCCSE